MRDRVRTVVMAAGLVLAAGVSALAQDAVGSIRGIVLDKDFGAPLASADITIVETGAKTTSSDQGNFVLRDLRPGKYTVVAAKDGYVRQVKAEVLVLPGQLTDLELALSGDFTDMEEFVVEETLELNAGSEVGLLEMRFESPALMDSIGADLISRAGASDAASALRLVAGATVQDGKSAVIRGLPDRYVSSQLNGVRLPTTDEDKRAVELDQFPAVVIESVQVTKTFTPDQQGDASGGAVNVKLKGIPKESFFFKFKSQLSLNSQVAGSDFLTYDGGGLDFFGTDDGGRDQQLENLGMSWTGAVGTERGDPPLDSKWSLAVGGNEDLGRDWKIGGMLSLFYERDSSFYDEGKDDSYWVTSPGAPMTPETVQGTPQQGDFKTALFDIQRASRQVQLGGLAAVGIETTDHAINLAYLYSRTAEDTATLAEDTRGKEYFFPGHDPNDPLTPGHDEPDAAPYVRLETLDYNERTTDTFQINGHHRFPTELFGFEDLIEFDAVELDWSAAFSGATLYQPDKRQFGTVWYPARQIGAFTIPATHRPFKPAANFNLGNLQRIWKEIEEESSQYAFEIELPFTNWTGERGAFKTGFFHDDLERRFDQDTFSNFNDNTEFAGAFEEPWSAVFPFENHPITASEFDVDYEGFQKITAWYLMVETPLVEHVKLVGGVRFESTDLGITNDPEGDATWFPPGSVAATQLNPGDGDAAYEQSDVLPAIGLEYRPVDEVVLRASYSQTVARQTFKELSPILQQEFLGGPIFIGNPELRMSAIDNYDLRADWTPYSGALVSASWFRKDITDPIEYVQRLAAFNFTTATNYPEGTLSGVELEVRQELGQFVDALSGVSIGANATFIDSEVSLPQSEIDELNLPNIQAPMETRDMTGAPEALYNLYLTWELVETGTQLGIFYTIQGDTLIAGAGQANGNFVPSLYAESFDTLNLSVSQKLGEHFKLEFQAKNLTNPAIETVYRSKYIGDDVRKTSTKSGIDLSLSLSAEFSF